MSEIKVNKISPSSGTAFTLGDSGDTFTLPSGATIVNSGTATGFGGGKIGQVVQTVNLATETISSTTYTTISDFTVAITPSATDSKVLVYVDSKVTTDGNYDYTVQLFRDTTQVYMGDAAGTRPRAYSGSYEDSGRKIRGQVAIYLDSPATTSEVEYSCKWATEGSRPTYMNRTVTDTDQAMYDPRLASSITVMEVLA